MKAMPKLLSISLAAFALLALPLPAVGVEALIPAPVPEGEDLKNILSGVVKEKEEKQLTLTNYKDLTTVKIKLNELTRYKKDDAPATFEDVVVGSHLKVKVKEDTLEALEVTILTEKSGPDKVAPKPEEPQ